MKIYLLCLAFVLALMPACVTQFPDEALHLGPESLAVRQLQSRRFDTNNNQTMLSAAATTLQDLGFTLDESEYTLGVLVASKQRDASNGGQLAGAILLSALTGAKTEVDARQTIRVSMVMREVANAQKPGAENSQLTPDTISQIKNQVIKAVTSGLHNKYPQELSLKLAQKIAENTATTLAGDLNTLARAKSSGGQSTVRVTFQRIIYNTAGEVTMAEQIRDVEIYRRFFDKLSQSVFLEAHEI